MRHLKFRYYDDLLKRLVYSDEFEWTNALDKLEKFFQLASRYASNGVVQQYTGLEDKNGVEIYEGDILTYISNNGLDYESPVVFSTTNLAYVLDTSGRHLFDDKYGDYLWLHKDHEYEIVGDIFENSEQLEV